MLGYRRWIRIRKGENAFGWCNCKWVNVDDKELVITKLLNGTFIGKSVVTGLLGIGHLFERINYQAAIVQLSGRMQETRDGNTKCIMRICCQGSSWGKRENCGEGRNGRRKYVMGSEIRIYYLVVSKKCRREWTQDFIKHEGCPDARILFRLEEEINTNYICILLSNDVTLEYIVSTWPVTDTYRCHYSSTICGRWGCWNIGHWTRRVDNTSLSVAILSEGW